MTTIIVNEKSKAGKSFLDLAKKIAKMDKNVMINSNINKTKIPNSETLQAMFEVEHKIGLTKTKNTSDLMDKLFS
jgi:ribosome-binding protein aMBF1 (putative translation factor)